MNEINSESFNINIDKPTIADLDVYFQKHSTSLDALRQSMQRATEKIIDLKANETATSLKELLDRDIQNVSDSVSNLENNMNTSFRDGVITKTECISIKNSLLRLDTEKADIDKNYESLYNNINLSGEAKTNLNSTYTAYVSIHTELVNYVNEVMVDNTATTEEITEIKNKLDRYNIALSDYKVAQNVAVNSIAEAVSNSNLAEYKSLVNKDISDINKKINDMTTDIGSVVIDGVIDETETMILANNIIELNKEKADIDARYENVYNNPNLSGVTKSNLKTRYDNYCLSHNSLIEIINTVVEDKVATESEKADLQTALDDYSNNLSLLSVSFNEAFKSISEAIANSVTEELRGEMQGNINDVAQSVENLNTYIDGAFKDSVLTDSEKESVRTYLKTLATERADIDNQYNTLYNNSDLLGTAKSNLKISYDNYVTKYNTLIDTINAILTYTEITNANKTKLDNDFTEHDNALATYSQRVNEAINSIAEKKKEDAKSYTDVQFNVLEDKIELRVTNREMEEYVGTVSSGLQNQIDGKIETYYQTTDPSVDWTTSELKTQHKGDIWYDSLNNITYRWGGIAWVKITDADAEVAKALATSKAQVFTSTPITPYKVGDLWVQGSGGDIMECIHARSSGDYTPSDWEKASKYTDDTKANEIANNLNTNYYTITETDSAINITKEGILSEVSSKYTTIDSLGDTLSEYTTKSELEQTGESIVARFIVGGSNLLLNGRPRIDTKHWDTTHSDGSTGVSSLATDSSINWNGEHFNSGVLWMGTYTPSTSGGSWCGLYNDSLKNHKFNLSKEHSVSTIIYNDSSVSKSIRISICNTDGTNTICSQDFILRPRDYHEIKFKFTPSVKGDSPILMYYVLTEGDYHFYIPWTVVREGEPTSSWLGNDDEVENGITKIDKDGITVSHTNVNTVSKMTVNGFYIEDNNGETIASLSSKERWTELKADKVFANNIENVYEGDSNLYVDHSKTVVGNGRIDNPFSCFYELRDYLEKTPIINKDLTINIVSTGIISDVLYLRGLKGRGIITININKNAIYIDETNTNSFIHLYDVQNLVTINGGRTGYATNDGALISGYKYGVFLNHCRYVRVEYIAINTKSSIGDQWGIIFNATNGMSYRVDFCDSPNAIYADYSSQICDADSCGNGTIAFYSARGSSIMFGNSEDNGYRPSGSLIKGGGNIFDLGNRSVRTSFRTAPAVPPSVNQYKDFSFSDYGYYSEGYGNWNSIGYKTVYQGDWGYGNNRGVFTLPNSDISSYLSDATILDGNQITLQRENAGGYSASQSIYLWGTTHTSASGSAPPLTKYYGNLGSLAWGERNTFTLPKSFVEDLKTGTVKSVMFYTDDGGNYIKFSAVCTLRLKVNKAIAGGGSGGSGGTDTPGTITISQSTYTIQMGEGLKVNYTSTVELTTCMLLFAPNYSDSDCINGNISNTGEFTFYTSSKEAGTYTVKVKGRKWNESTSSYVDSYSNTFTLIIKGESEEPVTPITIGSISDITVNSGTTFNIVYRTNVDAVKHEISLDGSGIKYTTIYPTGDKNGYVYRHEALAESSNPYQRLIRVTDASGNTATSNTFSITVNSSTGGGGEEPITPITIGDIDDITVNSGNTFNIVYITNIDAVKHEISIDGGNSYKTIHPTGDKSGYTYVHEALTISDAPYQRLIRVTDANGNTAISNTFYITVNSSGGGDTSNDIVISQSNYTIQAGQDVKVRYTSSIEISTCMLLYAPDYNDNNYSGGYISATGEFTFYTSSKSTGTYTVKVKGRKFNDNTQVYDDYYSNTFTITITDSTSGGGGSEEPATPITISNIDNITVNNGTTFNIVYTTNIDAVKHEISLDGGSSYSTIQPTGDKNGYTYQHEALTVSNSPYQRKIRVTDANGNTATSNTFNITVISSGSGGDTSSDITISQSSYTIQVGQDIQIDYTSSVELSTCMLLYAPDYNDNNYSGGYISSAGVFTFYTSSKSTGTYTVKVKGRKFNNSTNAYDDYYSNIFTIIIEDNTSGGGGSEEPATPIVINNISDMTVNSGSPFNIVYTTNVDAVSHEMSFDGGNSYNVIYPTGDKNGYTYQHEALTETSYPHQRVIRVRDANGNTATSNTFNITVSSGGSSGGSGSTKSPFLVSMYGDPRVIPNYPSGIQFPPINAHEDGIQPNGVNSTDSWKYGTRINLNPRNDWTRVGFWGQVYRQEGYGYDPDNVAVEIKDCKLWGWNGSSWVLIHDVSFSSSNTIFYVENFSGDSNKSFPSNVRLNGKNATAKFDSVNNGYMWHPYSGKARAGDYGLNQPYYYCSTMSARLVKWDSSGADNLDNAKLCFNVGGDFWHTTHETWQPDWSANGEYAQGQFIKCTREWRTAYCTNVPESWGNGFPSL